MEEGSKLPPQLLELWSEGSTVEGKTWLDLNEYSSALKRMRAAEGRVETERVSSAAFHPCASSLLMATGDTLGKVGLWKSGGGWGDGGALLFEPHSGPVGCMAFCRAQPTQLLSLSYDGSLRCMDVEKAVFHDVYGSNVGLRTFDFMSLDCFTLVVGNRLGDVAIVDRRTPGNTHESLHSLDPNTLRCVSVHPSLKHYFAVAESRVVNIYDCRYLKSTHSLAVSQLHGHSSSITSAYFSPCTGNRVLTTCMDNRIRHNMQTFLTKLSAVWDPKREDCFVVGSVCQSRMALAFHESGELQHSFIDREDLREVLSAIAIHPTRNAFLGCAASGRLHVFSD
ncbi:WD repeat-containing protein 76 [Liparis tanakae]|uniref:WD repeat-containing protein 76 n=1 Tax=Liparis tanakae TaxID=230148 RepID=A0A4Z2GFZ5_9TELE|nr:WD repeat-containing protein 76 [Liparis tanakae]